MGISKAIESRTRKLKSMLELLVRDPEEFAQLPICQPETLDQLLPPEYEQTEQDLKTNDKAVLALKYMALELLFSSISASKPHHDPLAKGLLLFWHTYLEPIRPTTNRMIPPLIEVMEYCAAEANLGGFLDEVNRLIKASSSFSQKADFGKATFSLPSDILASLFNELRSVARTPAGVSHEIIPSAEIGKRRRTFQNYLQRAMREMAEMLYKGAPELFEEAKRASPKRHRQPAKRNDETPAVVEVPLVSAVKVEGDVSVESLNLEFFQLLVSYIKKACCNQPEACGYVFPIEGVIDRTVTVHPIQGDPMLSVGAEGKVEALSRMSGVLVGVPGSGRTTFLRRLAYEWARRWSDENSPLAVYCSALDFLPYARNRRSVYSFIAELAFSTDDSEKVEEWRKELAALDQAGRLLLLVDDLDRLPEADQSEVVGQLAFSPAVIYTTVPWEVNRIAKWMRQRHVGEFILADLDEAQQRDLLSRLAGEYPEREFDLDLGLVALREVPYLAWLPLGILAVYAQVLDHQSNRARIAERALREYFERAGLTLPGFSGEWMTLDPRVKSLLQVARVFEADLLRVSEEARKELVVTRARYEQSLDPWWGCKWELLADTRLFEPYQGPGEALRFINSDLMMFCAAVADPYQSYQTGAEAEPILRQFESYADALWEDQGVSST
jgi:hypothetical protein